jgi:aspartate/methionine/tyrosine aminotransferase
MKVAIHKLFDYLLDTAGEAPPECVLGFSLSTPPRLGDFLDALDPGLALDWNGVSFQGLPALRERVIDQAGLRGLCSPDDVLITAGTAEANYLCFRQLLEPGDGVVTDTPGWPQAAVMARAVGATLTEVRRHEADRWHLDPAALARAVTSATRMIFLSNPNNPTGALMDAAALAEVVATADRVGAWLVIDEVYAGLEWGGPRAPSVAGLYPRGITTGSVSKALGMQGVRTGWMICRDRDAIRDAVILRENSSEIMNILGEHLAEIALRPERLAPAMARARAEGQATLAALDAFIAAQPRLSWVPPAAGLIGLARLEGEAAEPFARRLLGPPWRTFLLPGTAYGEPAHIRLGVGGGAAVRLDEGLGRLADCLAS